jgi:hypothetical protein
METGEAKFRTEWFVRHVFEANVERLNDKRPLQEVVDNVQKLTRELSNAVKIHDVSRVVVGNVELIMRRGYVHRPRSNMAAYPYGLPQEYDIKVNDLNNQE